MLPVIYSISSLQVHTCLMALREQRQCGVSKREIIVSFFYFTGNIHYLALLAMIMCHKSVSVYTCDLLFKINKGQSQDRSHSSHEFSRRPKISKVFCLGERVIYTATASFHSQLHSDSWLVFCLALFVYYKGRQKMAS